MPSVPLTKYGGGWGYAPGYLGISKYPKAKGSQPDAEIQRWIDLCEEYMAHDPEADVSRPLCFQVHRGSACRRLEGHG